MHHPIDMVPQPLTYSASRRRRPWKPYLLGVISLPAVYLSTYLLLRLFGVYYLFFDQGSWEMDGSTHVFILDAAFLPAAVLEGDVQNRLRWLREPTGG